MKNAILMSAALALLTAATALAVLHAGDSARAGNGSAAAMSVDMDPAGNTATSLGPRDFCAEAAPGSSVVIDAVVEDIPATHPMLAFALALSYDPAVITISGADANFLIASAPGSSLLTPGDLADLPDTDGFLEAAVADVGVNSHESGSGVLLRLTLDIAPGAPAGAYPLNLDPAGTGHTDPNNVTHAPQALHGGVLAAGISCADVPTPTPTPTPPAFPKGDVNCDNQVTSVDALFILRHVALLNVTLPPGCPPISQGGDMNCDNAVTSVDALLILRHVALLNVPLPGNCPPIG